MRVHTDLTRRFAANLKEERIKAGLSQAELASRLKIAENYLYQLEAGTRAPSMDLLSRAAEALKLDPAILVTA